MKHSTHIFATVLATALVAAGTASAAVTVNSQTSIDVVGSSTGAGAEAQAQTSVNFGAGITHMVKKILGDREDTKESAATTLELKATNDSQATVRASDSAMESETNNSVTATSSQVRVISTGETGVSAVYRVPGRFLGIIPITVNATVSVESGGEVEISYPWYALLVVTDTSDRKTRIENRVRAVLPTEASAQANVATNTAVGVKLSSLAQAQLLAAIDAAITEEATSE